MTNLDHLKGHKLPGTHLTFIERVPHCVNHKIQARFLCDCGKEAVCSLNDWFIAKTTSCGCVRKEVTKNMQARTRAKVKATFSARKEQAGFLLGSVW